MEGAQTAEDFRLFGCVRLVISINCLGSGQASTDAYAGIDLLS